MKPRSHYIVGIAISQSGTATICEIDGHRGLGLVFLALAVFYFWGYFVAKKEEAVAV